MICPVCNQNIPDGSNYCPSCAADLTKLRRQVTAAQQGKRAQPDPRMAPPQDPRMAQQYTGQYQPVQPPYGGGEGGIFEGITPRGKLFFGIGGLALLAVLVLLVVRLFGDGAGNGGQGQATQPPVNTEAPTYAPFGFDLFATDDPGEDPLNSVDLKVPTPTPAPTPIPNFGVLKRGASGPEVVALQERLQLLGFLPADAVIDGQYGSATVNAVRDFQDSVGLTTDGDAGPLTQQRLYGIPLDPGDGGDATQNDEPINQPG